MARGNPQSAARSLPEKKLYAEKFHIETGKPDHPAFMWGVGVQLSALAAADGVTTGKIHHRVLPAPWVAEYWRE